MARVLYASCFLLIMGVQFTGCSDDDKVNPGKLTLQADATLGNFLVDGNGKTLYFFSSDVGGQSKCTGSCLAEWKVYYAPNIQPGDGVSASDFGTITRTDGDMQTTYKGWPLYYFIDDEKPGDTKGEGDDGIWFVAKPDYSIMIASTQLVGENTKSYVNTPTFQEGTGESVFFVDFATGHTLYTFSKDFKDVNKFTKSDLSNNAVWSMYYTDITTLPSTLSKDDFGMITVFSNSQLTYKGHPLYRYSGDANPGDTKGITYGAPGIWPIATASLAEAAVQPTVMLTTNNVLGPIITDNQGRTLYFFTKDTKGVPNCTGGCNQLWPIFNVDQVIAGNGLNASDFASIGSGATKQLTYKGRPLHYFAPANNGVIEAAGSTGGDNFAGLWFAAKANYSLMVATAQLIGDDQTTHYKNDYTVGDGLTRYFTDGAGRTLYLFFLRDTRNTNKYTASDFSNNDLWPVFDVDPTVLPTGINASDFGHITVAGSHNQLTYKGWPVYQFQHDAAKGDTRGVSFGPAPGTWHVLESTTTAAPQ
jgi:predicted lipoprotein with Yx(FWY)xxD motif